MALRTIPLRRVGTRPNLFLGGDRYLVMLSGILSFALLFRGLSIETTVFGAALWVGSLYVLRLLAKADPSMAEVYLRHRQYLPYYPPRSTPWRENERSQGKRYKGWKKRNLF